MRVRSLLSILVSALAAAALARWPLTALPSYEAGLATGTLAAVLCCWLAFSRARRRPVTPALRWGLLVEGPQEQVHAEARATLAVGAVLVALPAALLASEAARAGCRIAPGLPAYLLVAAPAALAGTALGVLAGSISRRAGRATALVAALVLVSVALTAVELWVGPRHLVHEAVLGPITAAAYGSHGAGIELPRTAWVHRLFTVVLWLGVLPLGAWVRTFTDDPRRAGAGATGPPTAPPSRDPRDPAARDPRDDAACDPRDLAARDPRDPAARGPRDLAARDPRDPAARDPRDDAAWRASRAADDERVRFLLAHERRAAGRLLAVAAAALLPFVLAHDASGIAPGRSALRRALPAVRETPHFVIHHAAGEAGEGREAGEAGETVLAPAVVQLEFAWDQVTGWLDVRPAARIHVWLHRDADALFQLTGARGYVFAVPWRREIHVHQGGLRALRHEIVHVIAGEFGGWPFRASPSPGLVEGLATALDEGYAREPAAHEAIAAAAAAGLLPPADRLMGLTGFGSGAMDRAYRASASFVGWLLLTEGPGPVKRAYPWAGFEAAHGRPLADLSAAWQSWLFELAPSKAESARARRRFDPSLHPALHQEPCPRVGRLTTPTPAARARLLERTGRHGEASDLYCEAWRRTGDAALLADAAGQALRAGRRAEALLLAERALAGDRLPESRRDAALVLRGRLLAGLGQWESARQALAERRAEGLAPWPEELDLEELALSDVARREPLFAALLADRRERVRRLAALVDEAPDFAPAAAALLSDVARDRGGPDPDAVDLALRFPALAPGAPVLSARFLLDLGGLAEERGDWAVSERLHAAAADLPGIRPLQGLEAEDGRDRARLGLRLLGPQPPGSPCRSLP